MFKQYFKSQKDEYNTAGNLGFGLVFFAEKATETKTFLSSIAMAMPAARASMLVATAIRNIVLKAKDASAGFSSLFEKASRIILAPMRASRAKAIQWSYFSI